MLRSTFQLMPGLGPYRERQLWSAGITRWERFPRAPAVGVSPKLDDRIRAAIARAEALVAAGDAGALALMLPRRERWRLFSAFAQDALYLDIESDQDGDVTAIGLLDRDGPRVFVAGRNLGDFVEAARGAKLLVTFNGLSFDVPVLRRAFPLWEPPRAHVDLRHLWQRLGHKGGLKLLEQDVGLTRPPHLVSVNGVEAIRLWRKHKEGDPAALRLLCEYNLYDTVNLRTLMALGYNRLVEKLGLPAAPVEVSWRGDVLYDVTKAVLALG